MPQSKGFRVKTRKRLRKKENTGFNDRLLQLMRFDKGDKVVIYIDPSYHCGMPHRRYHGKVGTIVKRRGRALEVEVSKGDKKVILIVPPEHLKPFQS
ncbi:50S ribosomal protein L21e [Candidatus Geothermarchaeota archaeon]|nr:MAG: 50S ribosomal protein L21e [Candidatus Geothermarchaeota archaeon]